MKTSTEFEPTGQVDREAEWLSLVEKYPELKTVELEVIDQSEVEDATYTGGMLELDESQEKVRVCIVDFDEKQYQRLIKHRQMSLSLMAEQIGIPVSDLSPQLLKRFIFLHEVGHALNFERDYRHHPQIKGDYSLAYAVYDEDLERALSDLPVPYWYPSELAAAIEQQGEAAFMTAHPEIAAYARTHNLTARTLLAAQERAYKQTDHEQVADRFALANLN